MQFMLDTNTLVYVLNRRPQHQAVVARYDAADPRLTCISSITLAELRFGVEQSLIRDVTQAKLDRLVAAFTVMPFEAGAAHAYGVLRAKLHAAGKLIGPLDMLIAGHAISLGAMLVTNNLREFARVPGLRAENWLTS